MRLVFVGAALAAWGIVAPAVFAVPFPVSVTQDIEEVAEAPAVDAPLSLEVVPLRPALSDATLPGDEEAAEEELPQADRFVRILPRIRFSACQAVDVFDTAVATPMFDGRSFYRWSMRR